MRLVSPGDDGVPVRARLPRRLLVDDQAHAEMVDMLVSARLVTSDDGVIELAHEALARAWPRLRTWLEEDVDGQRVRHHVAFAADAWDALGRPDSEVYRGVRLSTALEWRRTSEAALTTTERDFLDRGERVADAERVAAAERAHVQQRTNRRLRGLLVVASALVVATLVAGLLAVRQARNADVARGTAEGARERADAAALTADSRQLGARALTTDDISLSLLLAVQGVKLESTPESRANLLAALAKRPQLIRTGFGDGRHITSLAVRPLADSWLHVKGSDSRWAIAASNGGNDVVTFDQAVDRMSSRHLSGHRRGGDLSVAYSPDGSMLAAGMNTPDRAPVQIIDAIRNRPLARQLPPLAGPAAVTDITFSGDGRSVAATFHAPPAPGASDRAGGATRSSDFALVWNPRRGDNPHRVDLPSGLHGLAVSKDARTVYTQLAAHVVRRLHEPSALALSASRVATPRPQPGRDGAHDAGVGRRQEQQRRPRRRPDRRCCDDDSSGTANRPEMSGSPRLGRRSRHWRTTTRFSSGMRNEAGSSTHWRPGP